MLPGIQLIIGLCHSTGSDKKNKDGNTSSVPPKSEHDHVLEHSLHQLLREVCNNIPYVNDIFLKK